MTKEWPKDSDPQSFVAEPKQAQPKPKTEPAARALLALNSGNGDTKALDSSTTLLADQQMLASDVSPAAAAPAAASVGGASRQDGGFYADSGVEEAVLRFVGSTLQDDRGKKRKAGQYDHDMSTFHDYIGNGSWDKFLSDDIAPAHHDEYSLFGPSSEALSGRPQNRLSNHRGGESRKRRRQPAAPSTSTNVVDPALAHMGNSAPPTLVEQAILQAREQQMLHQSLVPLSAHTSPAPQASHSPRDHHVADKKNAHKGSRSTWAGDGSESGGSFDESEVRALDDFMTRFCRQHNLDRRGLCERVWSSERKKDNFWDAVAAVLPHRTRASVYKHVRRTYHVFKVRARWTPVEDQQLGTLFREKGAQWKTIGELMHRMPEDCRDRWRNYVKCGGQRKSNKWSSKEEELLERVVSDILTQEPGVTVNWTTVSERMGGTRSRIQCRYKWKKLSQKLQGAQPAAEAEVFQG